MSKICFVIPCLDAGGMENYLLRFLRFLPDKQNITVLVRNGQKGDLYNDYLETSANIHFQPIGYLNFYNWFQLYKYFVSEKFDTICDFSGNFAGSTMFIARLANTKNRISFYRRSSFAFKPTKINLFYDKIMNALVKANASKILSNSSHAFDFFFQNRIKEDKRFMVIPNGIDASLYNVKLSKAEARKFFNLPENKFIIGHVGRFDPAKNHKTIFRVAKQLKNESDRIYFIFAGKGTDSFEFKTLLKEHGIEDICFGMGLQSDLPVLYKSMDMFYFPSITEGQPNALIEAMISGIPFLSSNIPPIIETVPDSLHYCLLNPKDHNYSVERILEVMQNYPLSLEMILKARHTIFSKFDKEKNFNDFLTVLN